MPIRALTPPLTPPLSRSPFGGGRGEGNEGILGGRLRRPPKIPFLHPPLSLGRSDGERGARGVRGKNKPITCPEQDGTKTYTCEGGSGRVVSRTCRAAFAQR